MKGQGGDKKTCHQGGACKQVIWSQFALQIVTPVMAQQEGNRHDRVANIVHTVFLGICSIHVKVRRRYECREEETGNNNTPYVS